MFIAGEEAPQHPEYVLATNPAYRSRNVGLWAAAGHDLGIPGFAQGGISDPTVTGGGVIGTITQDSLDKLVSAANGFIGAHAPSGGGGGGGAGSTSGLSGSLIQIVDQIAKRMGWGAPLIQDWLNVINRESGGSMTATNPSSGAYGIAQMNTGTGVAAAKAKYYSYGGNPNTMSGQLIAMANYMAEAYHGPAGAWNSELTRGAYRIGGLVIPGYAQGGIASAGSALLSGTVPAALGSNFSVTGALLGNAEYAKIMSWLSGLLGTDGQVNKITDLMSYWQGMWGLNSTVAGIVSGGPSAAILTDATGNQYIDQADVNTAISELTQYVGWESEIVSDLQQALSMSDYMLGVIPQAMSGAKGYIKGNLSKIASLKKGKQTASIKAQIAALQSQNVTLGGSGTSVGSGGLLGKWAGYLSTLGQYPDTIGGAGGSGYGGELGPAQISLARYQQELSALSPAALSAALATAQASSGSSQNSELSSLLEQLNTQLAQQYEVSQAQYGVLSGQMYGMGRGLPSYAGSYASGGIVPGFPGEPKTIIAHAGEMVSNGTPTVELHFASGHGVAQQVC